MSFYATFCAPNNTTDYPPLVPTVVAALVTTFDAAVDAAVNPTICGALNAAFISANYLDHYGAA